MQFCLDVTFLNEYEETSYNNEKNVGVKTAQVNSCT